MRKNSSFAGHALRLIAAASLACTVATVGCSTDRNPGAGAPQRYTPTVGPTPATYIKVKIGADAAAVIERLSPGVACERSQAVAQPSREFAGERAVGKGAGEVWVDVLEEGGAGGGAVAFPQLV